MLINHPGSGERRLRSRSQDPVDTGANAGNRWLWRKQKPEHATEMVKKNKEEEEEMSAQHGPGASLRPQQ